MVSRIINDSARSRQRAVGKLKIVAASDHQTKSRLIDLREQGSFRMIFPQAARGTLTAVVLNTSGGVTGGDEFSIEAHANTGAHLDLTTQAAERIYAALEGAPGRVRTKLRVDSGSQINWLPQETILFDQCALDRKLEVDIAADGRFLMVEPLCFGRVASGENLRSARFKDRVSIWRDGNLVYLDGISMQGDLSNQLTQTAIGDGALAMANIVWCAPDAELALEPVRALMTTTSGVSLHGPETLVVRALAKDGFDLRKTILPILNHLTKSAMPKNWRL